MGPPEVLTQLEFIVVCQMRSTLVCFDHISIIQTRNCALFFFMESLFSKEYSVKISKNFPTGSTGPQSLSLGRIY